MRFLFQSQVSANEVEKASQILFGITLALLAFGLVAAASGAPPGLAVENTALHGLRIVAGLGALLLFARIDLETLRRWTPFLLAGCFLLLVLVLVPGIGHKVNNARRWIRFGSLSIQPSEIVKVVLVLFLADFAARRAGLLPDLRRGFLPAVAVIVPLCGVVLLEPDFGTAVYLLFVSGAILVAGGARVSHFVGAGLFALPVALLLAWSKFEHVRARFGDLAKGGGYQVRRALESLGSGGMFGQGLGTSSIKHGYVPEGRNDFVAALIGEEWGWLGMMVLLSLFAGMLYFGLRVIYGSRDRFGALAAFGILFAIALQAGINLAVVAGIAPPKGIALPFVSSGGSSIVMMCAGIGIVANVARRAVREAASSGDADAALGKPSNWAPA